MPTLIDAVLELAIVQMISNDSSNSQKVIYLSPTKALCNERYVDWKDRFGPLGVSVKQWTGDVDGELSDLKSADIITTTPEKWHSTTKRWRDKEQMKVARAVGLVLIDEAHHINDPTRGATLEAVVSRMKTMNDGKAQSIRFIAVSATIPNITDLAEWLGSGTEQQIAISHEFGDEYRPVPLDIFVEPISEGSKFVPFVFDNQLNKYIATFIQKYNPELRPTLVFCATRKSAKEAAHALSNQKRFVQHQEHQRELLQVSTRIRDDKYLSDLIKKGVGYHHGGLSYNDRSVVEQAFLRGVLPGKTFLSSHLFHEDAYVLT